MKFVNSNSKFDYWKMSSINFSDNMNIVAMECGKRRRRDCDCDCDCDCDDCDDSDDYCDYTDCNDNDDDSDCYDADAYRRWMFDDDGYESGYKDGGDPYGVSDYD